MAKLWRVHHAELPDRAGETVALEPQEAHHVRRVLRLRPGDPVAVFDGRGAEWRGTLVACDPASVRARLDERIVTPVEPPLEILLFQGACRAERMDWLVQKATEVGLAAILPVVGADSSGRPGSLRLERWRRIALEACKQSGRRRLPRIEPAPGLPRPDGPDVLALLLDPDEGAPALGSFCAATPPGRVWLAAGPEGGFAPEEVATASAAGWKRAGLGPRTLRSETAGLVAAILLLHRWADLGSVGQRSVDSNLERT